jgi:hypothetical protein
MICACDSCFISCVEWNIHKGVGFFFSDKNKKFVRQAFFFKNKDWPRDEQCPRMTAWSVSEREIRNCQDIVRVICLSM